MDERMIGMCGAYCGICDWRERTDCAGCQDSAGAMFWGSCGIAKCCIEKGLPHCGLCSDLPCDMLQAAFDHPEHGDRGERLQNLRNWAAGDETVIPLRSLPEADA
jgi:hypothetical protein